MVARECSDEWVLTDLGARPLESLLASDPSLQANFLRSSTPIRSRGRS
jgi:hypothetical protein